MHTHALTLSPAPIWRMQHATQENTSPTKSSGKKQVSGLVPRYLLPPSSRYSTCGEFGSDVHALIKELAIIRLEHRAEMHPNESPHLAKGSEVARLRRIFCFVLQQALSFHRGWRFRASDSSVCTAWCLHTRIVPRGYPGPSGGKERTGRGRDRSKERDRRRERGRGLARGRKR